MWFAVRQNKKYNLPNEVFKDGEFLNHCISNIIKQKASCTEESKQWYHFVNLLDILYEVRQNLLIKAYSATAISSSLDLLGESTLNLPVHGLNGAEYQSRILSNDTSGMIINYPSGPRLPVDFTWRGKQILVNVMVGGVDFRFAMICDTDYSDQSFSTLRLLHSDSFSQKQRRSDIRYNVHIPAVFHIGEPEVEKNDPKNSSTTSPSKKPIESRSVVKDLSLGGCQILIGGEVPLIFSYVRIQFTYIKREDLQKICSFIYGIEVAEDDVPPTPQESGDFDEEGSVNLYEIYEKIKDSIPEKGKHESLAEPFVEPISEIPSTTEADVKHSASSSSN